MKVEVVYALPDRAWSKWLCIDDGKTVGEVLQLALASREFQEIKQINPTAVSVWGRVVEMDFVLSDEDRIEILRPLELEPQERRRKIAEQS